MENGNDIKERIDIISETIEAHRHSLHFMRGTLFFGSGLLFAATATAQFVLRMITGQDYQEWTLLAITVVLLLFVVIRNRRNLTVTVTDRLMMNTWMYAILICMYSGFLINIYSDGALQLPIMGFFAVGASIAAGITSEIYRIDSTNRSNIRGSQVTLGVAAMVGSMISAWIFVCGFEGEYTGQFILTMADIVILLFGTGIILRYNEHRTRV